MEFAFVSADSHGKFRASQQKLVRSHCMRGRNLTIGIRPAHKPGPECKGRLGGDREPSCHRQRGKGLQPLGRKKTPQPQSLPGTLGSSAPVLADAVDECSLRVLVNHTWYPFDVGVDFDVTGSKCIQWLSEDRAYLHATLFAAWGMHDIFARRPFGDQTIIHLGKTIASLNDELSTRASRGVLRESTIATIVYLVILCGSFHDQAAAQVHAEGLRQMISLHGGLKVLRGNPALLIRLSRVDFAYFLNTGNDPIFFKDPETWLLFSSPPFSSTESPRPSPPHQHDNTISPLLTTTLSAHPIFPIFLHLRHFTSTINAARADKTRISQVDFQNTICTIQHHLLALGGHHHNEDENSDDDDEDEDQKELPLLAECLRLAMLAFLTTTFQLPFNHVRYPHLAARFRTQFDALATYYHQKARLPTSYDSEGTTTTTTRDLMLWLLLIASISLYGVHDPWIRSMWAAHVGGFVPEEEEEMQWRDARERLRGFLWVDGIHGQLGRLAFAQLGGGDGQDATTMARMTVRDGEVEGEEGGVAMWLSGWAMCPYRA